MIFKFYVVSVRDDHSNVSEELLTLITSRNNKLRVVKNCQRSWTPATGLDNPNIQKPIAAVADSTTYY